MKQSVNNFINETVRRSSHLYNKNGFIERLMRPLTEFIPHDASGITTTKGVGFDQRMLFYGYPTEYLIKWTNQEAESVSRWKGHYINGPEKGFNTLQASEIDGFKDSEEYKSLYLPHNFIDGMQTMLFDSLGSIMGVYACSRTDKSKIPFSKEEALLFEKISPYIFYAFRKYRWLMHINFFDAPNLNELLYGVVICDKKGRMRWQNEVADHLLSKYHGSTQRKLPLCLKRTHKNIESLNNNKSNSSLLFRTIEDFCPYGSIVGFSFDMYSSMFLRAEGEGTVFFIDTKKLEKEIISTMTRREIDVISLMAKGMSDKEISLALSISGKTVQTYTQKLFKKLAITNRTEAAVKAVKLGLV
ncbi:MAG: LuxR C-terminal-related transcriptional regulator [bacterium]|nr:LuxR C-terminal-related transcriptional regulator [bacterium]